MIDLLADITLYTLALRGALALIWHRLPWWPKKVGLYELSELQTQARCGICFKAVTDVVPKDWPWSLCDEH